MKHFRLLSSFVGVFLSFAFTTAYADFSQCNQTFNFTVRYGQAYQFFDEFNASDIQPSYITSWGVTYENPSYLNSGTPFAFTADIIGRQYVIPAGQTVRVLDSGTNGWLIAQHPLVRTTVGHDFGIRYDIGYDHSNNYPDASDDKHHTECAYYRVSWCGDGILDTAEGETCDSADTTHAGWGTGGCNASCQPINGPVCTPGNIARPSSTPVTATTAGLCLP